MKKQLINKYTISLLTSLVFLTISIITISEYGINWDAPSRMMRGQAYAHYLLTGQLSYYQNPNQSPILIKPAEYISRFDFNTIEDFDNPQILKIADRPLLASQFKNWQLENNLRLSFYESQDWNGQYFLSDQGPGHPPLMDILAAFSNKIFYSNLKLLSDIESYQLLYILITTLGIFITSLFTYEISASLKNTNEKKDKSFPKISSFIAGLSLLCYPYFFAESHFNMKDPLQAVFFTGSVWSFWHWVKGDRFKFIGSLGWFFLLTIFIMLALGTKWNIVFLPIVILVWLYLIRKTEQFQNWFKLTKLLSSAIALALFSFITLTLISFPGLVNPFKTISALASFYLEIGTKLEPLQPSSLILGGKNISYFLPFGFNIYPLLLVIFQTPEIILLLASIGIYIFLKHHIKDDLKTGWLLILWLFVPILRVLLPHFWFYNGLRQIIEIIPAMAILSGLGAAFLLEIKYVNRFKHLTILLIILLLLWPLWQFHPNQNYYFNNLIGGLNGAYALNLVDKKISYGNIYKQAADWLNKNAEKDANIAFLDGPEYALSPLFLRSDLSISPNHFSGFSQKGEYIIQLFDPSPQAIYSSIFPNRFLKPVYQLKIQKTVVLSVYKNSPQFTNLRLDHEKTLENPQAAWKFSPRGQYLDIDLTKKVKVTRIIFKFTPKSCLPGYTKYVDEQVVFNNAAQYNLQERILAPNGNIEMWFPAEESTSLKIFPIDKFSCFLGSQISAVKYLE